MTDWDAKARAAIDYIEAKKRTFSEAQSFGLIDFFAEKGTATEAEMQAHGSQDFVATILGNVTMGVHCGGKVPKDGGWYQHPSGQPYTIDPGFAAAWVKARGRSRR